MTSTGNDTATIYQRPAELLQNLIRFNTTNPPGNEKECIAYINRLLNTAGIETTLLARDPERPNLLARLSGQGKAPPLLLFGHVDVVTTEKQTWQHEPFEGRIIGDDIWGRGALDMKGGVAMMLAAFLRTRADGFTPPGEVILNILSDEECGGEYGAKYLVENYAAQYTGVRYALGEFGGFNFNIGKKKFYPIMVAEKQPCYIEIILRGPSGHPTATFHRGAMAKLGRVLQRIENKRLPVHLTPAARQMIRTMSGNLPFPANLVTRQLLNEKIAGGLLTILGKQFEQLEPMLHNSVNAVAISGADNPRMIPDKISLYLRFNVLPGFTPDDAIAELRPIVGPDIGINVMDYPFYRSTSAEPDMGLFATLAGILREADPEGIPAPLLLPATTDGRFFSRLGIQTYGFMPMNLPADFNFWQTMHAADERVPVASLAFGTDAIYKVIQRFGLKDNKI